MKTNKFNNIIQKIKSGEFQGKDYAEINNKLIFPLIFDLDLKESDMPFPFINETCIPLSIHEYYYYKLELESSMNEIEFYKCLFFAILQEGINLQETIKKIGLDKMSEFYDFEWNDNPCLLLLDYYSSEAKIWDDFSNSYAFDIENVGNFFKEADRLIALDK